MGLTIMRFPMTVGAKRDRVFHRVITSVGKVFSVVDLQVWAAGRRSFEWRRLIARLTRSFGPEEHLRDYIRVALKYGR